MKEHHEGGMSFGGTLCLIFIVLKLCNLIDWSWIWVLAPIWISLLLLIICTVIEMLDEERHKPKYP